MKFKNPTIKHIDIDALTSKETEPCISMTIELPIKDCDMQPYELERLINNSLWYRKDPKEVSLFLAYEEKTD